MILLNITEKVCILLFYSNFYIIVVVNSQCWLREKIETQIFVFWHGSSLRDVRPWEGGMRGERKTRDTSWNEAYDLMIACEIAQSTSSLKIVYITRTNTLGLLHQKKNNSIILFWPTILCYQILIIIPKL